MKEAIFKFNADCGRMGELEGVFISTQERVDTLIESGAEVYFGEVLGKHSEIYGEIEKDEIIFVSDNEEAVNVVREHGLTSGFNPFDYSIINYENDNFEVYDDMSADELVDNLLSLKK